MPISMWATTSGVSRLGAVHLCQGWCGTAQGRRRPRAHLACHLRLGHAGADGLRRYDDDSAAARRDRVCIGRHGAVGRVAAQLARMYMARELSGPQALDHKVAHLREHTRLYAAFNYKKTNLDAALDEHCPDGIDVYWTTWAAQRWTLYWRGGSVSRARGHLRADFAVQPRRRVRVAQRYLHTWGKARVEGFSVYAIICTTLMRSFRNSPTGCVAVNWCTRKILSTASRTLPAAFIGMMCGDNLGKRLVQVATDPTR